MPRPSQKRENGAASIGETVRRTSRGQPPWADTPAAQGVQANGWRNRIVGTGMEDADQLLANPSNWRIHPQNQQKALKGSLSEVGWVQNVIVNQRTGFVVDGHARVALAISAGEQVPVVYVDLSEDEEKIILATIDPLAAMAVMDEKLLAELLKDVKVADDGLQELLNDLNLQCGIETITGGLTDPDAVPDVPETPVTVLGDLWVLGRHRLLCGDSTSVDAVERLMDGEKADMVFTDPPYGMNKAIMNDGDEWAAVLTAAHSAVHQCPVQFWWCSSMTRLLSKALTIIEPDRLLAWNKPFSLTQPQKGFAWHLEFCLFKSTQDAVGNASDLVNMNTIWRKDDPENVGHPTQKPVALFEALALHFEAPIVLDLFGGSGSTLIACEKMARNARLMELDPKYCDVIVKRWEQFTGQQATLDGDGRTFNDMQQERFLVKLGAQDQIAEEAFT